MSQPHAQFGKYAIIAALGSGTFAETSRARDTGLDREVALKILHPVLMADQSFVTQFRREARTLARLRHPHILTIYEVATIDGRLCLALELAEGGSLADLLVQRGRLTWRETFDLLGPICAALDYMHGQGVLHRDLKPSNLLLRGDGQPLIADFGLSRTAGQSLSAASGSRSMLGTPAYSAPELWGGEPTSPATDIYALACITYELLAGQWLFPATALTQAAAAHSRGPRFPAEWRGDAPAGLEGVLRKALAPLPEQRYQSAGAFYSALRALAPPDMGGRPTPVVSPDRRWLWLAAGGIVLALIAALGLFASGRWPGGSAAQTPSRTAPAAAPSAPGVGATATTAASPTERVPTAAVTTEPPVSAPTLAATLPPALVPALVEVPAGPFLMGSLPDDTRAEDDEKPQHRVALPTYWIGETEVTNAQFRAFVESDGYENPRYWTAAGWAWRQAHNVEEPEGWDAKPQWSSDDRPVVGVSWFEAVAYVRWLSAKTGHEYRLPTEAEWEKAARGTDGQIWPWGNEW